MRIACTRWHHLEEHQVQKSDRWEKFRFLKNMSDTRDFVTPPAGEIPAKVHIYPVVPSHQCHHYMSTKYWIEQKSFNGILEGLCVLNSEILAKWAEWAKTKNLAPGARVFITDYFTPQLPVYTTFSGPPHFLNDPPESGGVLKNVGGPDFFLKLDPPTFKTVAPPLRPIQKSETQHNFTTQH